MSTRSSSCSVTPGIKSPEVRLLAYLSQEPNDANVLTYAAAMDPHTASITMTMLQNPVKFAFEKVNNDLKAASSAHKKVGKALDKVWPRHIRAALSRPP